jgi:hypothetical protein
LGHHTRGFARVSCEKLHAWLQNYISIIIVIVINIIIIIILLLLLLLLHYVIISRVSCEELRASTLKHELRANALKHSITSDTNIYGTWYSVIYEAWYKYIKDDTNKWKMIQIYETWYKHIKHDTFLHAISACLHACLISCIQLSQNLWKKKEYMQSVCASRAFHIYNHLNICALELRHHTGSPQWRCVKGPLKP